MRGQHVFFDQQPIRTRDGIPAHRELHGQIAGRGKALARNQSPCLD
jgi:hypothetical protein